MRCASSFVIAAHFLSTQFSRPLTFFPHTFFHGFRGDRNGRVMMKGMEMGVAADVEESSVMMKGDADGTVSAQLGDVRSFVLGHVHL